MDLGNISTHLQAISEEQPAGPSLEYDAEFQALQQEMAPARPSMVAGDEQEADDKKNWPSIRDQVESLLARSKDLSLAIWWARASLHIDGFAGLAAGIHLLSQMLIEFWPSVHPMLDEEDDNDPTMRMNSLLLLVEVDGLLGDVREVPFLKSMQLGMLSLRQHYIAEGKLSPKGDETPVEKSYIESMLQDVGSESIAQLHEALQVIAQSRKAMDEKIGEELSTADVPDLKPFDTECKVIERLIRDYVGGAEGDTEDETDGEGATEGGAAAAGGSAPKAALQGAVNSRADAVRAIDLVCEYFQRNEPSSPVPMLLQRAKRLVNMSFMDILNDLAPKGVEDAQHIGGVQNESQE